MDKYEVIGSLGAGSFGRVYKARQLSDSTFVALKVISKRGRSPKELTGLRRECEIQRHLNHPNIIKMLDSFETKDEIVVITEFAHKELNKILGKEGYLSEDRVQTIVWDLVSALYYLHSHRVLHRDLKPQNILLDSKNKAKLCDFGFARNMSTGTHVLTSIKGTPLYMAPELIEEQPYDHNADLWSLGCIIYELLVGAPPFCTTSILHLIRLIRHEQIQWPTFLSENCISFLKGLLQKNPLKRMNWPEILNHPFVKGHIFILEDSTNMPLTRPLSVNSMQLKEQQRKDHVSNKSTKGLVKIGEQCEIQNTSEPSKISQDAIEPLNDDSIIVNVTDNKNNNSFTEKMQTLSLENKQSSNSTFEEEKSLTQTSNKCEKLHFIEENQPLENEEWIVFLQKNMEEILNGETTSLTQPNLTNIIVSPLRNINANSKVINYVAQLLSLPFVDGTTSDILNKVKKVYLEVKLVPNLVYSVKLLLRATSGSTGSSLQEQDSIKDDLSDEDFQCIEDIYVLITHLVYLENEFLSQFCDAVVVLNIYNILQFFLIIGKCKLTITQYILAILTHILRVFPENFEIIDKTILNESSRKNINFVELLRHSDEILRERTCFFLLYLGKHPNSNKMCLIWNEDMRETLEALMYDSIESVRNAADRTVEELKLKEFYLQS